MKDRRSSVTIDSPIRPSFQTVDSEKAHDMLLAANSRRDWSEVRQALADGERLFFSEEQMSAQNAKYLMLSLSRNGVTRTLHVRRTEHDGTKGRLLWLGEEKQPKEPKD
jgi:hypothetical protein